MNFSEVMTRARVIIASLEEDDQADISDDYNLFQFFMGIGNPNFDFMEKIFFPEDMYDVDEWRNFVRQFGHDEYNSVFQSIGSIPFNFLD